MKWKSKNGLAVLTVFTLLCSLWPFMKNHAQAADLNLTQYVNPFVGTRNATVDHGTGGGRGMTFPGATVPFGMVQWSPDTNWAGPYGGYDYDDPTIEGFSLVHASGTGCAIYQDIPFTPVVGTLGTSPGTHYSDYNSTFSHANEIAVPGYYSAKLDKYNVKAELSATTRTGMGQFTYPTSNQSMMLINVGKNGTGVQNASVQIVGNNQVIGSVTSGGFCGTGNKYTVYFAAQFDHNFSSYGTWNGDSVTAASSSAQGSQSGAYVQFATDSGTPVLVKAGVSYVSTANALANLNSENSNWDFNAVKTAAGNAWNQKLNTIQVTGGTDQQKRTFYTALYHSMLHPSVFSDVNGQYIGFDKQIHQTNGFTMYATYSGWDIYRSQMQLLALLAPTEAGDMAQSLVVDAEQRGGFFPRWTVANDESGVMVGDPGSVIVSNMYAFGARNFDLTGALKVMDQTASDPNGRPASNEYHKYGYIPASNGTWGPSATTLEYNSADFAIAQFANAVGDTAKYHTYMNRAQYWQNLFNPASKYIQPRNSDGTFVANFDPASLDGFVEGSSGQYTWMVPFNLRGLFDRIGGNAAVIARLDDHFTELDGGPHSTKAFMGNEPEHGTPWEYDFAGAPYKTQEVVRRIMTSLYSDQPNGIFGNDDLGATSAWYVWAAMGIYPEIPGVGGFVLGSPLFPDIKINLTNAGQIHIIGNAASESAKYVQSFKLNGQTSTKTWIPYSQIATGGTLEFNLSTTANTAWGSGPADAPPSFDDHGGYGVNLALNKTVTADSSCVVGESASNAVDGTVFNNSKWCSKSSDRWLQIDLGSIQNVNQFVVKHAAEGGEEAAWNTKAYSIQVSSNGTNWSTVVNVTNNKESVTAHSINTVPARYIKLIVTTPAQNGDSAARIYELQVYGPASSPIAGTYKLINLTSGKALDVTGSGTADGINVQIYTDNGSGAQKWTVTSLGGGVYKLVNPNSGKALDVDNSGTADGTNVRIWSDNGTSAQQWRLIDTGDGYYKLINVNSNKALDVTSSGTADGTNVQIYTDNATGAQQWKLVKLP